jgi:hydrogenase nickel incorporation protein HypB
MEPRHVRATSSTDNDRVAAALRAGFERRGILCLNLISSPGAGKTTLLEHTLQALVASRHRAAVLTADIESERDAERLARFGFPARQVATGGISRLQACTVSDALEALSLDGVDLLFIENVGSLVSVAPDLGEGARVVMLSVAEGNDKPLKHAPVFASAKLMLLHKIDLLPYTRFDVAAARADAKRVNPHIEIMETSCVGAPGLQPWLDWLERQIPAGRVLA